MRVLHQTTEDCSKYLDLISERYTSTCVLEEPYAGKLHIRFWCAAKAAPKMEEDPPAGTGQADLPNSLLLL
ncbi:hypothetical protein [Mahella sp.]|uniref:hypothetical protein n=1 Tax=Mahella sp. TaxID=2798721 RepID=UPI0025BF6298|nr:hypothetical protein [Mahella sp.]